MNNAVSQPTAVKLREAGWEWETEFIYIKISDKVWLLKHKLLSTKLWLRLNKSEWLPVPSVGELREKLNRIDFKNYWHEVVDYGMGVHRSSYEDWLYTVTASADALAEVWLFTNKKGE